MGRGGGVVVVEGYVGRGGVLPRDVFSVVNEGLAWGWLRDFDRRWTGWTGWTQMGSGILKRKDRDG